MRTFLAFLRLQYEKNAGRQASIFVCIEALETTEIQLGLEKLSEFHMPITDKLGNELRSSETTVLAIFINERENCHYRTI